MRGAYIFGFDLAHEPLARRALVPLTRAAVGLTFAVSVAHAVLHSMTVGRAATSSAWFLSRCRPACGVAPTTRPRAPRRSARPRRRTRGAPRSPEARVPSSGRRMRASVGHSLLIVRVGLDGEGLPVLRSRLPRASPEWVGSSAPLLWRWGCRVSLRTVSIDSHVDELQTRACRHPKKWKLPPRGAETAPPSPAGEG